MVPNPTTFDLTSSGFILSFSHSSFIKLFSNLAVITPTDELLRPKDVSTYV